MNHRLVNADLKLGTFNIVTLLLFMSNTGQGFLQGVTFDLKIIQK